MVYFKWRWQARGPRCVLFKYKTQPWKCALLSTKLMRAFKPCFWTSVSPDWLVIASKMVSTSFLMVNAFSSAVGLSVTC